MTAWWPHNVKYPDMLEYYKAYDWLKTKYANFFNRVIRCWQSRHDAIQLIKRVKKPNAVKWLIDERGRECTKCNIYKDRSCFGVNNKSPYRKTCECLECRRLMKKHYREKWGTQKDREFRLKKRKLEIWSLIAFHDPIVVNWNPREIIWEVKDYKTKKWHLIYSQLLKQYRRLDTNDNHARNKNCKKFYKVQQ